MRRLLPHPADLDDAALVDAYRPPDDRFVRANMIASLDGVIAIEGRSGALGSPGDRRIFGVLRALADVVLVGHGTAAAEGYRPVEPGSAVGRLRAELGRPRELPIAVVSRRATLAPGDGLAMPPTVLVTCGSSDPGRRRALEAAGVTVLVAGNDDVDLPLTLELLAARGFEHVLCEGGPHLLASALTAGVVDELALTMAPALVGGESRLLAGRLPAVVRPELRQVLEEDGVLFTRYRLAA